MPRAILVADDHVDTELYERALGSEYSFTVTGSTDRLEQAADSVDVVVLDRTDGGYRDAIRETRREEWFVIVVTDVEPTPDLLSTACDDYLHKPVAAEELRAAVSRATELRDCDDEIRDAVSLARKAHVLESVVPATTLERHETYRRTRERLRELAEPELLAQIERIDHSVLTAQLRTIRRIDPGSGAARTDGGNAGIKGRAAGGGVSPWKFREAVESAGHAVAFTDLDGTIEYVNPAFEEMTGYSGAEVIGETPSVLNSGTHDESFYADLWETVSSGEVWQGELVNERADGETYVIEQTIAPIPRDGDHRGYVAINTDITEKRRRERKIEALHEATRDLLGADSPGAVAAEVGNAIESILEFRINVIRVLRDGELHPVHVNDKAEELLEERPAYEVGEGFPGEAFEKQTANVYTDIRERDRGEELEPVVSWLYVPIDGYGVISVGQTEPNAFDQTDLKLVQILASNAEIALQRLEHERELKRENERLERFASTVSHDLRNPLQVAEGTLNQLHEEDDQVDRVRQAHERMEEVIEGVLTLTREGNRVEDPQQVDISTVAADCWDHVSSRGAHLVVEDDSPEVAADEPRLKHLFENLFRNAVTHGEASTVRVGTLSGGFYVADDGVGIPPESREAVFDTGYTTSENGTGIGLAIVDEIARAHDWNVSVTESVEGGARFEFRTDGHHY